MCWRPFGPNGPLDDPLFHPEMFPSQLCSHHHRFLNTDQITLIHHYDSIYYSNSTSIPADNVQRTWPQERQSLLYVVASRSLPPSANNNKDNRVGSYLIVHSRHSRSHLPPTRHTKEKTSWKRYLDDSSVGDGNCCGCVLHHLYPLGSHGAGYLPIFEQL